VDRIIEYDAAFSREEHLHRVGRTARAGKEGQASVFLMPGCEEGYVEVLKSEREKGGFGMNVRGMSAEQVLQSAFDETQDSASTTKTVNKSRKSHKEDDLKPWEEHATNFQLDIERWVLNNSAILEAARRAYQSHIRAYATHVKEEREWFDIKQLHLGHLAKAFGLRDRPGNVSVPGMRASAGKVKEDRRKAGAGSRNTATSSKELDGVNESVDLHESRHKMRKMGMMKDGANEFNLA
jgi:ATP-dependent RNA helicase DDX31/DBP7